MVRRGRLGENATAIITGKTEKGRDIFICVSLPKVREKV
jgi:hypothetical protein